MKRAGSEIWAARAAAYAEEIGEAYHRHRIEVIKAVLPPLGGAAVVDFGCGEGVLLEHAAREGARTLIGIDIERSLLSLAERRAWAATLMRGGVEQLSEIDRADCLIAANVIAYLTPEDEKRFYTEAARIIRSGGTLVVTHSNALFDLFTFNAYTVDFCRREFGADVTSLLAHPTKPQRASFNIRENPLAYRHKLARYGFQEERQEFMNRHSLPPLLSGDDPDDMARPRPDTLTTPEGERWKLMFQCSMFASRAVRAESR